jgi:hypothetical protein
MMVRHSWKPASYGALALICAFWATAAQAAPITFSFTGYGSGELDVRGFSNLPFQVIVTADTNDVQTPAGGIFELQSQDGSIEIAGIGLARFTDPVYVFTNQSAEVIGFGSFSSFDLIDLLVTGVGLDTYDLTTSFGPIFDERPLFSQFENVSTDLGPLTFTDMFFVTFEAAAVPEPSAALCFLLGSALVGRTIRGLRR